MVSKTDCENVVKKLVAILEVFIPKKFDLIAYGSYAENWRDDFSDLDAILYFKNGLLPEIVSTIQIHQIQRALARLYEEITFLKKSNFFADVFILDEFHGADGRFMIYDTGFIHRLLVTNKNYSIVWGNNFLKNLSPVSLRHQEEFQLSMYLQEIRNYLIFEIPRLAFNPHLYSQKIYKYFATLPRFASIVLGSPINRIKDGLDFFARRFPYIDYKPLDELHFWESKGREALHKYLANWSALGNCLLIDCWRCYELTLAAIARTSPARSKKLQEY